MKPLLLLLSLALLGGCVSAAAVPDEPRHGHAATFHALRLHPGDDVRAKLEEFVAEQHIHAGFVASCAGSLRVAAIRFADRSEVATIAGPFEIVSLSGTLGVDGSHLHIAVSDGDGKTLGGHLAAGAIVYTTAEIVVGDLTGARFRRETDPATTYKELVIQSR